MTKHFTVKHAAGETEYRVIRPHRDCGYYECVSVRGISGTHHFVGGVQVFHKSVVNA